MQGAMLEDSAAEGFEEYLASMPPPYATVFLRTEIQEHFDIVSQRQNRVAHVALWRKMRSGGAAVCVIADDQPGLLSLVTLAFDSRRLDVTGAQIFCRRRSDAIVEAVDFFWVRRLNGVPPLVDDDLRGVGNSLSDLILQDRQSYRPPPRVSTVPVGRLADARVYFDAAARSSGESVLVIETRDCPGLLFAITSELHRQAVEIVNSDIRTEHGKVKDRFTLAREDGRALDAERLAAVERGVFAAVRALVPRS
jgi:[protein-PII] uridylyltransferase